MSEETKPHDARAAYGRGRITPQRRLIARTAETMAGAFTVEELATRVRAADATTGVATVYRAVASLEQTGWIERVGERTGSVLYARCGTQEHHHHLVCTGCGRVEPATCPLEAGLKEAAERAGFLLTDHDVVLYGLCASCRTPEGSAGRAAGARA